MTAFSIVVLAIGAGLLVLGASSAIALFVRALNRRDQTNGGTGLGTLWGLFLLGLGAGLLLIWWALP